MRRIALVPIAMAIGALGSHAIFPYLEKPARVALQPVAVVTGWEWSGIAAWLLYAATMTLGGIGYVSTLRALRREPHFERTRLFAIVLACALALAAAYAFRFIFSSDIYAYAAYGGFAAMRQDPYVHHTFPPTQVVNAQWTATIGFEWPWLPPCLYGPGFVAIARTIVTATHFDLAHAIVAFRVLEMIAFVLAVWISATIVPQCGALLAATIGLNPIVISTIAEGHNDALILLVIACAALIAQRRPELGGFIAGASGILKPTGVVVAVALAYALASRRFVLYAAGGIALAIAVQLIGTQLAGGYRPTAATDFVGTASAALAVGIRGLIALALSGRALYLAGLGARARVLALGALIIWALYPNAYPWYGVWLLPLAAFTLEEREGPVLVALTFTSILRYLSDAYGFAPAAPWLELISLAIPLGLLVPRGKPLPT